MPTKVMTVRPKERESDILRTIMDGLAAKRIWAMRCNTGGMFGVHKGKRWAVKFGRRGMADILAIFVVPLTTVDSCFAHSSLYEDVVKLHGHQPHVHLPMWIECKTATGKQSADQAAFQAEVTAEGHRYIIVRSWEDLVRELGI